MARRGFSLIELVVCCVIFVALSVLVFSFFRYGTRAFQKANQKHGLQMDALRCIESLQFEFKRSSRSSVYDTQDDSARELMVEGEPVRRDAISFATLKDWKDSTNSENFDLETAAPRWNRYWVFYATRAEEGHLIRLKVDPNPAPEGPVPLLGSDFARLQYDDPNINIFDGVTPGFATLARNVFEFKITSSPTGAYTFSLKLKERHRAEGTEPGARRDFDYYELETTIRPENTFPN